MSKVKISTHRGDMICELYDNETPITVNNFLKLTKQKFYDGLNFHRVIPDFMIQGGCPNKNGTGGPGYTIPCEVTATKQFHDKGVLSMAHAGRNTGGSQFFICHNRKNTQHLDGNHTCFGRVIEGDKVIDAIRGGDQILSISILPDVEIIPDVEEQIETNVDVTE
jgi:cyclophilin family peptidyl-prolyl cis-trans isomerase